MNFRVSQNPKNSGGPCPSYATDPAYVIWRMSDPGHSNIYNQFKKGTQKQGVFSCLCSLWNFLLSKCQGMRIGGTPLFLKIILSHLCRASSIHMMSCLGSRKCLGPNEWLSMINRQFSARIHSKNKLSLLLLYYDFHLIDHFNYSLEVFFSMPFGL